MPPTVALASVQPTDGDGRVGAALSHIGEAALGGGHRVEQRKICIRNEFQGGGGRSAHDLWAGQAHAADYGGGLAEKLAPFHRTFPLCPGHLSGIPRIAIDLASSEQTVVLAPAFRQEFSRLRPVRPSQLAYKRSRQDSAARLRSRTAPCRAVLAVGGLPETVSVDWRPCPARPYSGERQRPARG